MYSVVQSDDAGYVVMLHRHADFNEGKADTPSIVVCECDTLDMAEMVVKALRYYKDKPYGPCGGCLNIVDDTFEVCPHCGYDPA